MPDQPLSGVLEFLDPRAGVDAVTAPGDPYGEPFRVRPQAGLLIVFPSWLYHWVHPYTGQTPRIAVSFNAALAPTSGVLLPTPTLEPIVSSAPALRGLKHMFPEPPAPLRDETRMKQMSTEAVR